MKNLVFTTVLSFGALVASLSLAMENEDVEKGKIYSLKSIIMEGPDVNHQIKHKKAKRKQGGVTIVWRSKKIPIKGDLKIVNVFSVNSDYSCELTIGPRENSFGEELSELHTIKFELDQIKGIIPRFNNEQLKKTLAALQNKEALPSIKNGRIEWIVCDSSIEEWFDLKSVDKVIPDKGSPYFPSDDLKSILFSNHVAFLDKEDGYHSAVNYEAKINSEDDIETNFEDGV